MKFNERLCNLFRMCCCCSVNDTTEEKIREDISQGSQSRIEDKPFWWQKIQHFESDEARLRFISKLFVFSPEDIQKFYTGERTVDCTVVARAAEAGELDFLKWCVKTGHKEDFDETALGYAVKGRHPKTVAYVMTIFSIGKSDKEIQDACDRIWFEQ